MVTREFGDAGIGHRRVRSGAGLPRGLLGTARQAVEGTAHGARRDRPVPCHHPVARLAAPDGAGGVWITANAYTHSRSSLYLHWRAGTWTGIYSWPPPSPGTEENTVVAQIPGSQRVWGAGAGADGGNIELYTP